MNELMNSYITIDGQTTAPPLPPASNNVAPPLPPTSNANKAGLESEKNDSDIFDDEGDDDYVNSALELNAAAYGVDVDSVRREVGIVRPKSKTATKVAKPAMQSKL